MTDSILPTPPSLHLILHPLFPSAESETRHTPRSRAQRTGYKISGASCRKAQQQPQEMACNKSKHTGLEMRTNEAGQACMQSGILSLHRCPCCEVFFVSCYEGSIPACVERTWRMKEENEEGPGVLYGYLRRLFTPSEGTSWEGPCNPHILTRYDPRSQITNYLLSRKPNGILYPRLTTAVVAVDGACRGNGTYFAQARIGVYFGPDSCYNLSTCLSPETFSQTSNVAEIVASLTALQQVETQLLAHYNPRIEQVVLITNSEYVVKSMSEYIWRWLENGFTTSKRTNVKNEALLLKLHRTIERFKEDLGIDVRYWRVDREFNKDADRLANEALDESQNSI